MTKQEIIKKRKKCQETNELFLKSSTGNWRPISGYEDKYIINESGIIRSIDRIEIQPACIRNDGTPVKAFQRFRKGRKVKQRLGKNG